MQWEDRQSIMFLFPLITILPHSPIIGPMDIIQTPELILIHVYYIGLLYRQHPSKNTGSYTWKG
jgi:hypothetical protein